MASLNSVRGVLCSLGACVGFAIMYFYSSLMRDLSGESIYAWRIVVTIPFLAVLLLATRRWHMVTTIFSRLKYEPLLWLLLPLSALFLGVQFWLFMWAPNAGHALDVSLGYFLLPITLVFTSGVVFHERITPLQMIACGLAIIGVANEIFFAEQISWPAFVVAVGYPLYYGLRKVIGTANLGGLLIDMMISLPVVFWILATSKSGLSPSQITLHMGLLIVGLGVISVVAVSLMLTASQILSLALFGLLSYVEPVLLVVVALVLGEKIESTQWITYLFVWLAIVVLIVEGTQAIRRHRL